MPAATPIRKTCSRALSDQAALAAEQDRFLDELFADMIGFAGAKIIRRIFGFAHNADFELIADRTARAKAEIEAVRLARLFLLEPQRFRTPRDIVIEAKRDGTPRAFSGVPLASAVRQPSAARLRPARTSAPARRPARRP